MTMRPCVSVVAGAVLAVWVHTGAVAKEPGSRPALTAPQIVAKNAAARGGLEAWRKIQTMVWVGHLESASAHMQSVQFVLQEERPNKTRFETTTTNQKGVRAFDGVHGWKLRVDRSGSPDPMPYTPQEDQFERAAQVIDGPLIDYAAKGNTVALEGIDKVEGRKAYRLAVRVPSGEPQKVWIDAQTFLDLRYERVGYGASGRPGLVSVFYRDYRAIDGLQIPSVLEIGVESRNQPDRLVIEKVLLNPVLDARLFAKPAPTRRRSAAEFAPPESTLGKR
jgi:hypothetical protein